MHDQANQLRNLVLRARASLQCAVPPPRLIVLTGGKGGVGTTTVAINAAVSLGQLGKRVVLVDADLRRGDVAAMCGLKEDYNVADVMSARRTVHEALQRGPAGIQIVPGAWAPSKPVEWNPLAQRRLIQQLKALGRHADIILLDAGSDPGDVLRRYWQAADQVVLVTTPDPVATMDTYATIKGLLSDVIRAELEAVVNRVNDQERAAAAYERINTSCQRFLGRQVGLSGYITDDELVAAAGQAGTPVVLRAPQSSAVRDLARVAVNLSATRHDSPAASSNPENAA